MVVATDYTVGRRVHGCPFGHGYGGSVSAPNRFLTDKNESTRKKWAIFEFSYIVPLPTRILPA